MSRVVADDDTRAESSLELDAICWLHLKTTNAIESTKVTKGPGSKAAGPATALKLIEAAQGCWRALHGPHHVALVHNGAMLQADVLVERRIETTA